jgi:hypothetical protein
LRMLPSGGLFPQPCVHARQDLDNRCIVGSPQPLEGAPVHPLGLGTFAVEEARGPAQAPPDGLDSPRRPALIGLPLGLVGQPLAVPTGNAPPAPDLDTAPGPRGRYQLFSAPTALLLRCFCFAFLAPSRSSSPGVGQLNSTETQPNGNPTHHPRPRGSACARLWPGRADLVAITDSASKVHCSRSVPSFAV